MNLQIHAPFLKSQSNLLFKFFFNFSLNMKINIGFKTRIFNSIMYLLSNSIQPAFHGFNKLYSLFQLIFWWFLLEFWLVWEINGKKSVRKSYWRSFIFERQFYRSFFKLKDRIESSIFYICIVHSFPLRFSHRIQNFVHIRQNS